jgi:hypothetical protein
LLGTKGYVVVVVAAGTSCAWTCCARLQERQQAGFGAMKAELAPSFLMVQGEFSLYYCIKQRHGASLKETKIHYYNYC